MALSSNSGGGCLVEGLLGEQGVEDVAAAAGQADQGGVVLLALGSFAVVVGPADRVAQGGKCGEEHRAFELFVPGPRRVLAADGRPEADGDRCQSAVGGEVAAGREAGGV